MIVGNEVIVARNTISCKREHRTYSCGCLQKERVFESRKPIENTFITSIKQKTRKDNTSGRRGVYYRPRKGGYEALITVNKKTYYLGFSKDFNKACKLRELGEEKYFSPLINKE